MTVREEVVAPGGAVDTSMVLQGFIRIGGAWVGTPEHVLAFQGGCLGGRDMQNSHLKAIWIPVYTQVG